MKFETAASTTSAAKYKRLLGAFYLRLALKVSFLRRTRVATKGLCFVDLTNLANRANSLVGIETSNLKLNKIE